MVIWYKCSSSNETIFVMLDFVRTKKGFSWLFLYLAFSSIISDRWGSFEEQYFLSKGNSVNLFHIVEVWPSSIDFCPWEHVWHVITVAHDKGYFATMLSSTSSFHQDCLSVETSIWILDLTDAITVQRRSLEITGHSTATTVTNTFILDVEQQARSNSKVFSRRIGFAMFAFFLICLSLAPLLWIPCLTAGHSWTL